MPAYPGVPVLSVFPRFPRWINDILPLRADLGSAILVKVLFDPGGDFLYLTGLQWNMPGYMRPHLPFTLQRWPHVHYTDIVVHFDRLVIRVV